MSKRLLTHSTIGKVEKRNIKAKELYKSLIAEKWQPNHALQEVSRTFKLTIGKTSQILGLNE